MAPYSPLWPLTAPYSPSWPLAPYSPYGPYGPLWPPMATCSLYGPLWPPKALMAPKKRLFDPRPEAGTSFEKNYTACKGHGNEKAFKALEGLIRPFRA